jgi:hypothetical protein
MQGIELQFMRECIEALCKARSALLSLSCSEAISKSNYGKGDSLCLDAAPEIAISRTLCDDFDRYLPLITEEIGSSIKLRGTEDEVVYFSDPMDRSKVLRTFLEKQNGKIKDIFEDKNIIDKWEAECGDKIELSGPYGSITAIRHDSILFNVMINYITGIIYIASDAGVGKLSMSDIFDENEQAIIKRTRDLLNTVESISFGGSLIESKKFIAFCSGKKYEDNLISAKIFANEGIEQIRKEYLKYDNPGGPARILYLKAPLNSGFILSNGEKIGEWLGWLAYVKYSPQKLRAYEISFDSTWTRDQILMAPGPAYSILVNNIEEDKGIPYVKVKLNMSKLKFLDNPSRYRSTILICPETNREIIMRMNMQRRIELRFVPDENRRRK